MKIAAIICEYDPFHRGHKRQIEIIRENFGEDTAIISLMSGSTVQRGRLSVYPKQLRAEAAIRCGSDLVLELPCPWSCSSAEFFATGAVSVLNSLNAVDVLAFGSECGDLEHLTRVAEATSSDSYLSAIRAEGKGGHIKASEDILRDTCGVALPSSPNDILGVEYISALMKTKSGIMPFTYKREEGWSATESRRLLSDGADPSEMIPEEAMSVFGGTSLTDSDIYSAVALHVIRASDEETLSPYFGMNGGVSGLIKNRAEEVNNVDELVSACTGKSYTSARIRRAILSAVLKITESDVRSTPSFTTLLAANERGRAVLHRIKKTSCVPIISKVADGMSDPDVSDALSISLRADKLMALCRHEPSGKVFKTTPVII